MFDASTQGSGSAAPITVAQAIDAIDTWTDEPPSRRRDLTSALSTAAHLVGLPRDAVVLTPAALRASILTRSPSFFSMTEKRMKNVRSALRAVLRRLGVIDPSDTPFTKGWTSLLELLPALKRPSLTLLARYCSMTGVEPEQVSDDVFEAYRTWLDERTLTPLPTKKAGEARGAWNRARRSIA